MPLLDPRSPAAPLESVATDCVACGYDLRGLPPDRLCPECAFPIARSLEGTALLRGAGPEWLARVYRGLKWLTFAAATGEIVLIAYLFFLVVSIVIWTVNAAASAMPSWLQWAWVWPVIAVTGSGILVMAVAHTGGCLFVSSPTIPRYSPPRWARFGVRSVGALLFVIGAYGFVLRWKVAALPPGVVLLHRAIFQAAAIWYLFSLHTVARELDRRTTRRTPETQAKHRRARRDLWATAMIMLLPTWGSTLLPALPISDASWGFTLTLLALASMRPTLQRIRDNVAVEFAIAQARERGLNGTAESRPTGSG